MPTIKPLSIVSPSKRKIYKRALLTREGETYLFEQIKRGGPDALRARDEIVASSQGTIRFIARYYKNFTSLSLDDLMQEGNLAILRAIEKFEYWRGYRFSSYAKWWLRKEILYAIQNTGGTIRLPVYLHQQKYRLNLMCRDFRQSEGREPTIQELIELTGFSAKEIKRLTQGPSVRKVFSLNEDVFKDNPSGPDFVEQEISPYPAQDELVDFKLNVERVKACFSALTPNQRRVIQLRFGIDELTLEEAGSRMGISHQGICQLEARALERLKRMARAKIKRLREEQKHFPAHREKEENKIAPKAKVYFINLFSCAGRLPAKIRSALKTTKLFRFPQALLDKGKDLDLPVAIHYGASRGLKQNFYRTSASILGRDIDFILLSSKSPKEIRKGNICLIFNLFETGQNSFSNFVTITSSIKFIELLNP